MKSLGAIVLPAWAAVSLLVFLAQWLDAIHYLPSYFKVFGNVPPDSLPLAIKSILTTGSVFALSALCWAGAAEAARPVLSFLGGGREAGRLDRFLFSSALGFGLSSLFWTGLGMTGLCFFAIAALFAAVLGGVGILSAWKFVRGTSWNPRFALLLAAVCLPIMPSASAPEREIDSLVYHLALPSAYAAEHKMIARTDLYYSSYTQGQEMLSVPALLLGSETGSKMPSFWAAVLSALVVFSLARRFVPREYALAGALLLLASPLLMEGAARAKNDALLVFIGSVSLAARLGKGVRPALLAGVLAGAAWNFKNTAVLVIAGLLASFLADGKKGGKRSGAFALGCLPFSLPWIARNWLNLGAPLAPFLIQASSLSFWTAENARIARAYLLEWADVKVSGLSGWFQALLVCLAKLNVIVLLSLPIAIFSRARLRDLRGVMIYCGTFLAAWLLLTPWTVRFALPVLPALLVISVAALKRENTSPKPRRYLGLFPLVVTAVFAGIAAFLGVEGREGRPLACFVGIESREMYSSRVLGNYFKAAKSIQKLAAGKLKTIAVGEWRSYPLSARITARGIESSPLFWEISRDSQDARRLGIRLRQMNAGYVLYNLSNASYWAEYSVGFPWPEAAVRTYGAYWDRHAEMLWHSEGQDPKHGYFILYALKSGGTDRPFRGWLPGTEGEYFPLRKAAVGQIAPERINSEFARLKGRFGGRAEYIARLVTASFYLGRFDQMVEYASWLDGLFPECREIYAAFGAVSFSQGYWPEFGSTRGADAAKRLERRISETSGYLSLLFNLGLSPLVPAE